MKVGFIGLGTMGSSMALNVRAAGYDIFVNDIRREAGAAHLQAGASWGDSAQGGRGGRRRIHVAAGAERNRRGGARGGWITRRHARGTAWFDLSTNSPTVVRRLHERFAAKGVAMLDSPVSGGPPAPRAASSPCG